MRRTARAVITLGTAFAFLLGADGTMLFAQAAAPASGGTAPAAAAPAAAATAPVAEGFSKDQLEQLVAPIALYPDALLMQILMGATYPLEVVEADRFMKANPGLKDAALEAKLKDQEWDPSVKSLCTLPDVLKNMSENLDWTQDLGDAFLGQKAELLDTVQIMRGKANEAGNLKTTEQQTVTVKEDKIIVIESSSPEVVYVPTYSPTVVYGAWAPPSYYYPPMYPYYPPGAGLISFGIGMAVGGAIWGNCNWGWGHGDVDIDVNRYNNFNRNTNINADRSNLSGNRASWNHDASHRKGVGYQNSKVAGQYGAQSGTSRVTRDQAQAKAQARGYSGEKAGTRQSGTREARTPDSAATRDMQNRAASGQGAAARDRQGSGQGGSATRDRQGGAQAGTRDVQGGGDRAAGAKDRAGSADRSSASQRSGSASTRSSGGGSGKSAYSGASKPSYDRASSSRGSASRGTTSYGGSRGGGGGARAGGGGGRRR